MRTRRSTTEAERCRLSARAVWPTLSLRATRGSITGLQISEAASLHTEDQKPSDINKTMIFSEMFFFQAKREIWNNRKKKSELFFLWGIFPTQNQFHTWKGNLWKKTTEFLKRFISCSPSWIFQKQLQVTGRQQDENLGNFLWLIPAQNKSTPPSPPHTESPSQGAFQSQWTLKYSESQENRTINPRSSEQSSISLSRLIGVMNLVSQSFSLFLLDITTFLELERLKDQSHHILEAFLKKKYCFKLFSPADCKPQERKLFRFRKCITRKRTLPLLPQDFLQKDIKREKAEDFSLADICSVLCFLISPSVV